MTDAEDPFDDDGLIAVYNQKLIALAGQVMLPVELAEADIRARAVSPVCGSEVEVALKLSPAGTIEAFGYEVEACALTKACVAVMKKAIIGKTRADVARAGAELAAMLAGKPVAPSGDWVELAVLEPVKDYKARHNSILLPFEAVEKAFAQKDEIPVTTK
jgi:NifU-like protein involved in Fe-S cluster formation